MKRLALAVLAVFAIACAAAASADVRQRGPVVASALHWRMIGPFRGGRTVAVTGVPGQPNLFYIAAVNGGVWRSTDAGRVWTPIFDGQSSGSIGAIAVAPSDARTIYVGSGEGLQRPDLATGNGMYVTHDAGATWTHLGLRDAQQIGKIVVDPHDSKRLFVAALGHPYGPNTQRGVYRSLDGGATFERVLFKNENTGAIDVELDPSDAQTVYADMWAARRAPWTSGSSYTKGPAGSGLYKSIDGGTTWSALTTGLPTQAQNLGRIGLGIAPSQPSRIYATVDAREGGGIYRSDDAGASWKRTNSEVRVWGRADDFAGITVDPKNPDIVYSADTSTYRSIDGGTTFAAIKGAPGGDDYHTVWINPDNPQIILLGSDQGATISVNGGATWSSWYNQPTAQFYHVSTDNRFPYWVYGAQQESGSAAVASRGNDGAITFREFHPVGAEEYGYVAPDPLHPNLIFGGKVTKFDWTTMQTQDVSPVLVRGRTYRFDRTAPLMFSAADPHALYLGANVIFKTTNGGRSWATISPDLTRMHPGVPPNFASFRDADPRTDEHRGVVYSLGPSPRDAKLLWAGTDDGLVWVTRDGGTHWSNVTPPTLGAWNKIAQIDASHFDTQTAYIAVNTFRLDDLHPHIYRTHDGGVSWTAIVTGLPGDASVNTVREDPERRGLLFAGTERTVYVSFDDGNHWQSLQNNLPSTSVRDLVVHGDDVVVGTHGRSFWILDDITPLRQTAQPRAATLFAPQVAYRIRRDINTDTPLPPEEPAGENPPDGAIVDYFLPQDARGVTLEVFDARGALVRRYASTEKPIPIDPELNVPTYWIAPSRILSTSAGMHRFVWDLHAAPPKSLRRDYPISAIVHAMPREPRGVAALPGTYQLRLRVAGVLVATQPLVVKMDPRVRATAADLSAQAALATRASAAMSATYDALAGVRGLRAQLDAAKKKQLVGDLAAALDRSDREAAALADASDPTSFARLHRTLARLYAAVTGADAAPTDAQIATYARLARLLNAAQARWQRLELNLQSSRFRAPGGSASRDRRAGAS